MQTKLKVEGMKCGNCKASVENALAKEAGVTTATADIDVGHVNINNDRRSRLRCEIKSKQSTV